jgi:undecaprenyl-diphosphatase
MVSTGVIASLLVLLWTRGVPRGVRITALVSGAVFAIGVGVSRVYFGVHYPSDVLGAWLAATAWVSAVTGWMYPRLLPGTKP